jgi:hypothetical protein
MNSIVSPAESTARYRYAQLHATLTLIQNRGIALDPAPDGDVINGEIPLGHDLLQIAVSEGISRVSPNAQEDDHVFEMPPSEQRWPSLGHDKPYQISSCRICNRTQSTTHASEINKIKALSH